MRKRTDANHTEIIGALRQCGFAVHDTSAVGKGFPDCVAYRPREGVLLVEIKDGRKPPSARRLTRSEETFASRFPVVVLKSLDDVIRLSAPDTGDAEYRALFWQTRERP